MKRYLLLFSIVSSFNVNAAAPFGLEWGSDFLHYGEVVQKGVYKEVVAIELPEHDFTVESYRLLGTSEAGLMKASMKTFDYLLFSEKLDFDYAEQENLLQANGFQIRKFTPRNTSSYECILHSNCTGRRLEAYHSDGTSVVLEVKIKNRNTAYIYLEYSAQEFTAPNE
ncbi:hypothetical protein [Shewanella sp. MBTL60-007]|uniref:hypothetical protein n=1 Tax=Shewanella sp. MBTL60-007 TaxID=2815911 RepID=UPI001BC3BC65|nr:hypothetical protein [Shewanella sp. MBTL60-007]GIU31574.1 hypothetical protein TUM3792_43430 [Shewanella sp. MBTL60-007]